MTHRACLGLGLLSSAAGALAGAPVQAASCAELTTRLARLSEAESQELVARPTDGTTFKQLYDACDRTDRFAGKPLPTSNGVRRRCSSDPNRVDFVRRYADGTIVFRSKMGVDADGAPVSRGPHASSTDQPETWLTFDRGSAQRFVNAEEVSFVVVPLGFATGGISFRDRTGIGKGDLAAVFHNGRCSLGVVGDAGPYFRLGEASIKAHEDLGNPQCEVVGQRPCRRLKARGSGTGIGSNVTYVIFPGTRPRPLLSQTVSVVAAQLAAARMSAFLDRFAP